MEMQDMFYGNHEPAWLTDNMPLEQPVRYARPYNRPFARYSRDVMQPLMLRPKEVPVTVISHPPLDGDLSPVSTFPGTIEVSVPLCCEKCINKVKNAFSEVEGVQDVVCDQLEQKVTITGNVNPDEALTKVREVKKGSIYWNTETSVDSATPATSLVHNTIHQNGYTRNYVAPPYYTHYYADPVRRSYSTLQSPSYYSHYSSDPPTPYHYSTYHSDPYSTSPYVDTTYNISRF